MNSRSYLDYFPELEGSSHDEQLAMLEQARYLAFNQLNLSGRAAAYLLVSLLLALVIVLIPLVFMGFSMWINGAALCIGLFVSNCVYRRLYGRLLYLGLLQVLHRE